jgi:hypothetical protein
VESLVPLTAPGFTTTVAFGSAPPPSTRSCELFSSDRVTVIAAAALAVLTPNAAIAAAAIASRRSVILIVVPPRIGSGRPGISKSTPQPGGIGLTSKEPCQISVHARRAVG